MERIRQASFLAAFAQRVAVISKERRKAGIFLLIEALFPEFLLSLEMMSLFG
jgi:hypothetical protein